MIAVKLNIQEIYSAIDRSLELNDVSAAEDGAFIAQAVRRATYIISPCSRRQLETAVFQSLIVLNNNHPELQKEINELELEIVVSSLAKLTIQPTLFEGIDESQLTDPELAKIREDLKEGNKYIFCLIKRGDLMYGWLSLYSK